MLVEEGKLIQLFFNVLKTSECFLTGNKKAQPFGAVALICSLASLQKNFVWFGSHLNLVLFKPSPELSSLVLGQCCSSRYVDRYIGD